MSEWETVSDDGWETVERPRKAENASQPRRRTLLESLKSPEDWKRGAGLTGRTLTNVVTALPLAAMDFGIGARNLLTGSNYDSASKMWNDSLNAVGVPQPATALEKGVDIAGQMVLGSKMPMPTIGNVPPGFVSARPTAPEVPRGYELPPQMTASVGPSQANAAASISATPEAIAKGGGYTFGTVGDDASAGLNSTRQQIEEAGKRIGMRTTPGQATGSRSLQQMEAKLESQPMTSGPFNTIKANNAKALNRATAKELGEKSDVVDSNVLARANERLGAVFEGVRDETPRNIDPRRFVEKFQAINDEFEGLLPKNISSNDLVKKLQMFAEKGSATGHQLGNLSSKLGKAAHKEMTSAQGDRELGQALGQVKEYVDDLVEQGLKGKQLSTYQDARTQYRTFLSLLKPGVTNTATGDVSGLTLANVLARTDKYGYLLGKNQSDMYNAARFAQANRSIVGDSGTATRMPLQGVTDLVTRIPANLAVRAYTSSPAVNLAVRGQQVANKLPQIPFKMTPEQQRMMMLYSVPGLLSDE